MGRYNCIKITNGFNGVYFILLMAILFTYTMSFLVLFLGLLVFAASLQYLVNKSIIVSFKEKDMRSKLLFDSVNSVKAPLKISIYLPFYFSIVFLCLLMAILSFYLLITDSYSLKVLALFFVLGSTFVMILTYFSISGPTEIFRRRFYGTRSNSGLIDKEVSFDK